jgi:hypothetical protein
LLYCCKVEDDEEDKDRKYRHDQPAEWWGHDGWAWHVLEG